MSFLDFNNSKLSSFEPSEFDSENFSVDEFIQRKRYSVPLDVLRDDLGSHLKSLRSSLIELINQDYGQFVNLSSNLVGLDGKIQNIIGPLTRAQADLQNLQQSVIKTLDALSQELAERRSIRTVKTQLQLLRRTHTCLESSEKYLEKLPLEIQTSSDFSSLKIACDKVADTGQLILKCLPSPLVDKMQSRLQACRKAILDKLDSLFRLYADAASGVTSSSIGEGDIGHDRDIIVRSLLFMYSKLNCEGQTERILVNEILASRCKSKCDTFLYKKGNISTLLSEIEDFIQQSPIVRASRELETFPWMKEYDFVGRGVFPYVVGILMKQSYIWTPSTPETFHSNWLRCSSFIEVVENILPSVEHLEKFRNSDILREFVSKWQFNVYFQLRFQSLAIELESALDSFHSPCPTTDFKLDATRILVKVINQCWDREKIFIDQLFGRFLKASALFISRFLKEFQTQVTSNPNVTLGLLIFASADLTMSELVLRQIIMQNMNSSTLFQGEKNETRGAEFLSAFAWNETREALEAKLVELTVGQCISSISSVTEVPRLFRRTNRDVPTKPSEYVTGILQPIQTLYKSMKDAKQGDLLDRVGDKVGHQIISRYKIQMDEVLISVQRMEESLKRLKKIKGNQNQQVQSSNNDIEPKTTNNNLSDDDKIRRQIQIDFDYLTEQIRALTT